MAGLGTVELIILGGLAFSGVVAAFSSRSTKLVLQKLATHESASPETMHVVELVGRQQGLISFLLTLLGISPITDFRVTPDEICCNSTSVFGRSNQSVPLRAISSVAAGVRKPVGYLFMAFALSVIGVFGGFGVLWRDGFYRFIVGFIVCAVLAGFFIWLYAINKRFFVSIYTQGGPPILLSLKPNVIEGVPLDLEQALQVVKIIRDRVLACTTSGAAATPAVPTTPLPSSNSVPTGNLVYDPVESATSSPSSSASFASTFEYEDFAESVSAVQPADLLQQARDLIKQGQRQEAISVLRELIQQFPGSQEASTAMSTLEKAGITI